MKRSKFKGNGVFIGFTLSRAQTLICHDITEKAGQEPCKAYYGSDLAQHFYIPCLV
jgi:hypothetical protein